MDGSAPMTLVTLVITGSLSTTVLVTVGSVSITLVTLVMVGSPASLTVVTLVRVGLPPMTLVTFVTDGSSSMTVETVKKKRLHKDPLKMLERMVTAKHSHIFCVISEYWGYSSVCEIIKACRTNGSLCV